MDHGSYAVYPGRQYYVGVVPRKYQHMFFEGVQSMDATPTVEEITHGQYGFENDIITDRVYTNMTGTVSTINFGYAQKVLRAMCGQNPDSSFIFDPARLEAVDVFVNTSSKDRSRIVKSDWWVDFTPSVNYASTLDEADTYDFDYTAKRQLTFEGYQIVLDTWANTEVGMDEFVLRFPAVVDPVMDETIMSTVGVLNGKDRHALCPIQYGLRVWVDGHVLANPDEASLVTTAQLVGSDIIQTTRLYLKTPLSKDGQIVKVMYLVDGRTQVEQTGISRAPLMVQVIPTFDLVGTPGVRTWGTGGSVSSNRIITVVWNKTFTEDLCISTAPIVWSDFVFEYVQAGSGASPVIVSVPAITGEVLNPATVVGDMGHTGNLMRLEFPDALSSPPPGGDWEPDNLGGEEIAHLRYIGSTIRGLDDPMILTPHHYLRAKV